MRTKNLPVLEVLESRTLLSAAVVSSAPGNKGQSLGGHDLVQSALAPSTAGTTAVTIGQTLNFTAGVAFTGLVAFYASPVLDPPLGYFASIDWGDGSVNTGSVQYQMQGNAGGYGVTGTHTYSNAGLFKITITVSQGPINPAMMLPIKIVAQIVDPAIVAPAGNSSGGVTIHETAGQSFTDVVGSFSVPAPATDINALITWGDGEVSTGQINPAGVTGLDVLNFTVSGTHTYDKAGTYPIHIFVTRRGLPVAAAPLTLIASIDSTAIVTAPTAKPISLAGTISGTYSTSMAIPDIGRTYYFAGSGNAGDLGTVAATAIIQLPGLIAAAATGGRMVLANANGSVTLQLTGALQAGFSALPATLNYLITAGTGAYAGSTGSGTIALTLTPSATARGDDRFTMILT